MEPDPVEVDLVDFLQRTVNMLTEFTDRLHAVEQRVAAAEDIPGQVAAELAASITALSQRVDEHDTLFETVERMSRDLHALTENVRERMEAIRRRPKNPRVN